MMISEEDELLGRSTDVETGVAGRGYGTMPRGHEGSQTPESWARDVRDPKWGDNGAVPLLGSHGNGNGHGQHHAGRQGAGTCSPSQVSQELEELSSSMSILCRRCMGRVPVVRQALPQIHEGFWTAYLSIRGQLFSSIKQSFERWGYAPVYATGHSLGGALACLAALDLNINFGLPVVVYNFGTPRIGNFAFSTMYNAHVPATFRVVVDGDIIPGMPKLLGMYRHAGVEVLIDAESTGNLIVRPSVVESSLIMRNRTSATNHSLTTYRDCLEACFSPEDLLEYLPKVSATGRAICMWKEGT